MKLLSILSTLICTNVFAGAAPAGAATKSTAAPAAAAAAAGEAGEWLTEAAVHKREKRVIVIVGTAGSGTRNIHSLLAAAGVWMHPDTNKEFDSNIFIKRVKETAAFGMPGSRAGLIWETRNSPADYQLESLSYDVYNTLLQSHIQAAEELLAAVPDNVEVWGWKEPQAIYTLPFLYRVFPNLHVIHELRDGRDVALSNLNSTNLRTTRKFQRYYIQTFAGREYSDWQLYTHHFSKAAAAAWAHVNLNAKKWATENGFGMKGQYSITRLEDFCDPATIHIAIRTMFRNAGVPFTESSITQAAAAIDPRKCETDRWRAAWDADNEVLAAAIRGIDASIGSALEAFSYRTQSPLEMQSWLAAPEVMTGLREVALYAAKAIPEWDGTVPPARPIILTEVSNGYEAVLENWLNWLEACGVDLTRVLVVTKGSSAAAVKQIVDGMGPVVFEMPALETPPIQILNKNDDPVLNTLWVERMRILYEIVGAGVPVIMSDLDAIWFKDALSDIQAKADVQPGGYDMALSQGMWPPEAYRVFKTSGCLGLAFFNATPASKAVLRHMLHHAQRSMHIMFDDQQALNHQLVMANLAVNSTTPAPSGLQDEIVVGRQITTAPQPMRVLFLPHVQYQRFCDDATMGGAVVAHCRIRDVQNFKTPQMKQQVMRSMGLWKKETRDWLISPPLPEPAPPPASNPDFWLPPAWLGQPPPLDPLACTPQLLIIAAPKAGTTAVYDYLNGSIAGFTVHSEDIHFLNGSLASKQYVNAFRKLPEEKRRFHPRLAGSFLKEMHIFDGDAGLIPDRLKQFPGINGTLDDPLAGICSYEAASMGLHAADEVQLDEAPTSNATSNGSVQSNSANVSRSASGEWVTADSAGATGRVVEAGAIITGGATDMGAEQRYGTSSINSPEGMDASAPAIEAIGNAASSVSSTRELGASAVSPGSAASTAIVDEMASTGSASSTTVLDAPVVDAQTLLLSQIEEIAVNADSTSVTAGAAVSMDSPGAKNAGTSSVAADTLVNASVNASLSSTDSASASVDAASPAIAEDSNRTGSSVGASAAGVAVNSTTTSKAIDNNNAAEGGAAAVPALVRFEATPAYLHTALAVVQLKELLPQARYLALLREPVSRVISHFNMKIQGQSILEGIDPANYSSAWADYIATQVDRQMSAINKCKACISRHSPVPAYTQLANCLFGLPVVRDINEFDLYKGLYDLHLERWFHHFSPQQTLIWSSRAFSQTPKQHLQQLVNWLGLDAAEINSDIDFVKIHERSYPEDRPLPGWLFQQLVEFHEPHKTATLALLERVGYVQLAAQMRTAWEEELAYTQQKLVRALAHW